MRLVTGQRKRENSLLHIQIKMWKKHLYVALLLHSEFFVAKAIPNPLSCSTRAEEALKLCASLYLRTGTVVHKIHLLSPALTTAVIDTIALGFIYSGTTSQGRKKEKKKRRKKSTKPATPLAPQSNISFVCKWEVLFQQTGTQCTASPVLAESSPSPCSIPILLTYSQHEASGKCLMCCRWTSPAHAYCAWTAVRFGPPLGSEVRCMSWPSRNAELHCLKWSLSGGVGGYFYFAA